MKAFYNLLIFISIANLLSCSSGQGNTEELNNNAILKEGFWRATLEVRKHELPFNFEVKKQANNYEIYLLNNDERLKLDEINITNDSIEISLSVFDATILAKISDNKLKGAFIKNYLEDYIIPFEATYGLKHRFEKKPAAKTDFTGKWEINFDTEEDHALGVFKQEGDKVTGSILTTTGDYRYLEGTVSENNLFLSTFDGSHAFLFEATLSDKGQLSGEFWSGSHHYEKWTAVHNEDFELPNANELTFINNGYAKFDFSFPDLDGKKVSPLDPKYKGKVRLIQLFGTWCPNCMDETKFYAKWYKKNKDRGVEIIALAYEKKDDFEYAKKRVEKMKKKLGVEYDFLIAGNSDKEAASKTLPMINKVMSFPTTIFVDRNGTVRRIHTGFTGPGTGKYYDEFINEFTAFTDKLIAEKEGEL